VKPEKKKRTQADAAFDITSLLRHAENALAAYRIEYARTLSYEKHGEIDLLLELLLFARRRVTQFQANVLLRQR
jgi:hypothetical protein